MQLKNFLSTLATAGDICLFNHVAGMWPLLMTVYLEEGHGSSNSTLTENRSSCAAVVSETYSDMIVPLH